MANSKQKTIRFRGKSEPVLQTFRVRGRTYFALEKMSRRGAFRVFDSHAGPQGDYRILYQLPKSKMTRQSIETLRRMSGPNGNRNFPGIVDFAQQNGDLFVVIAWVNGTSLREYLAAIRQKSTPRPSVAEVVRLTRGLVHGVSHYHRKANVVHGDISPANIILTSGTTQLVLIDFGSAWPIEHAATKDDGDGVTQPYAAPERMAGHAAQDFRSDIFSLSAVAYELLTLQLPFGGLGGRAGLPNMPPKIVRSYQQPSKLASVGRLPRDSVKRLDDCVGRGLALHPDERFATSQDWLAAWDELHFALKKGTRLNGFETVIVDRIASLCSLFRRGSS